MSKHRDRDGVYDRDARDIEYVPQRPRHERPRQDAIDYHPIDEDESYALELCIDDVETGEDPRVADGSYRAFVRRHRRYE